MVSLRDRPVRGARVLRLLQVDRRADDVAAPEAAGGDAREEAAGTTETEAAGAVPAPRAVQAAGGQEAVADAEPGRHQGLVSRRVVGRGPPADRRPRRRYRCVRLRPAALVGGGRRPVAVKSGPRERESRRPRSVFGHQRQRHDTNGRQRPAGTMKRPGVRPAVFLGPEYKFSTPRAIDRVVRILLYRELKSFGMHCNFLQRSYNFIEISVPPGVTPRGSLFFFYLSFIASYSREFYHCKYSVIREQRLSC